MGKLSRPHHATTLRLLSAPLLKQLSLYNLTSSTRLKSMGDLNTSQQALKDLQHAAFYVAVVYINAKAEEPKQRLTPS